MDDPCAFGTRERGDGWRSNNIVAIVSRRVQPTVPLLMDGECMNCMWRQQRDADQRKVVAPEETSPAGTWCTNAWVSGNNRQVLTSVCPGVVV